MNYRNTPSIVTLVVPVFNESDSIGLFLQSISKELSSIVSTLELIFIDDGSVDDTLEILVEEKKNSPISIKIISLSRNFGKEAALTAGLDAAKGDVVVPIDVDLQDPPELILEFIAKWKEGYDVVYGVRVDRSSDTVVKRKTSEWFYKLFSSMSDTKLPANAGDFRLLDKKVVQAIARVREKTRFMKGIFSWVGFKSCSVEYSRPERAAGSTKWNYRKLLGFAIDGIFSFSELPLKVWVYIGMAISFTSFVYAGSLLIRTLVMGVDLPGYASMMVSLLFLGGIQLISIGILGEYIGRIFFETKQRPIYIIDEIIE